MKDAVDLPAELLPSQIHNKSGGAIEEILNCITHAAAGGFSMAGLVVLLVLTSRDPSPWKYVGFSVYGASQILLFFSSAFTHGFASMPRVRRKLAMLDHSFIYVLIAGTYTPVCLIAMRGNGGWMILGIMWAMAAAGIVLKTVFFDRVKLVADLLYIPMGWMVLFVFRRMMESTSPGFVTWAMIGGASYTVGVLFYAWRRLPYSHVIWHLFVIGGSLSFLISFVLHLA